MGRLSAPVFQFGKRGFLTTHDSHTRSGAPSGQLALTGPSVDAQAGHLPVRGDLAHIKLAGRFFVPHYAVPMPHEVAASGAILRSAGNAEADEVTRLQAGSTFDVLDIAGGWAWGQAGEDGFVGYVAMDELERNGQ